MFIVKVMKETIVYNRVKKRYEVTAIRNEDRKFESQEEMIFEMNDLGYEYKPNIYKNQSGWIKVVETKPGGDNSGFLTVSTGMIYAKK